MGLMTLDEAIIMHKQKADSYHKAMPNYGEAADHRQLAEWLTELKELRGLVAASNVLAKDVLAVDTLCKQILEYKRLLKLAVEDFAKLDRENAKNKNCMMPEMDCADCPLSWDSVDDRVEPCHSWRYANEAKKLINDEK